MAPAEKWQQDARVQELTNIIREGGSHKDVQKLIVRLKSLLGPNSDERIAEYAEKNHICVAVVPFLDAAKVSKYYGFNSTLHAQSTEVKAKLRASHDAMQARGGLSAAVDAICSGSPDEDVLLAVKSLAVLLDGADAPNQLASREAVRNVLLTLEHPHLPHRDMEVLCISCQRLITQCPGFAEALLAAYDDLDVRVACSALHFSMRAVNSEAGGTLRKAGLAKAAIAMLSHPFAYCRSQAVLLCAVANQEWLAELRDAGVVHALVKVLHGENSEAFPQGSPDTGYFTGVHIRCHATNGSVVTVGFETPSFAVCPVFAEVDRVFPPMALEFATAPGFAAAFVHICKESPEEQLLNPAVLLRGIVRALQGDARHKPLHRPFAEDLLSAGLLKMIPRFADPSSPLLSSMFLVVADIIKLAGYGCVAADSVPGHTTLLLSFILFCQSGHTSGAVKLLEAISFAGLQTQPCQHKPSSLQLTEALVKNLAGLLTTGLRTMCTCTSCTCAVPFILRKIQQHPTLLGTAMDSGFFPGLLNVLSIIREGERAEAAGTRESETLFPQALMDMRFFYKSEALVREAALEFLSLAKDSHIAEGLTSGLLAELQASVVGGTAASQRFFIDVCEVLLVKRDLPGTASKLREAGVIPGLLLQVAESSEDAFVLEYADWLKRLSREKLKRPRNVVVELIAAGLLEKLTQTRQKMSEHRGAVGSVIQMLHRYAQSHHSAINDARSRASGDGSRKQTALQLCGETSGTAANKENQPAAGNAGGHSSNTLGPASMGPDAEQEQPGSQTAKRTDAITKAEPRKKKCKVCAHCGKSSGGGAKLQACAGCLEVAYCGRDCQRSHWLLHKSFCKAR